MTSLIGHERANAAFLAAASGGALHHAWLLIGPAGVGKAGFARAASLRLLAAAVDPDLPPGLDVADDHRTAKLLRAGSHPDFRLIQRLPRKDAKEAGEGRAPDLARNVSVDQVRALLASFATTPALSPRRVVVIDAIDDLERGAANALLKGLEEPPAGTVFLLVSHMPGRLLPTIRSRCRVLRFEPLGEADMARALAAALPEADQTELRALVRAGGGSPGRALGYAGLDLAAIDTALASIAADGDRDNARRLKLAQSLASKAAQPRYEAFLERVPTFLAHAAAASEGPALRTALTAYQQARELAGAARGLSLDAQATVFELAGLVARLASAPPTG